jgi:hypothetical protein
VETSVAALYEARATVLSVDSGPYDPDLFPLNYSGTFGSWLSLGTSRTWQATADYTDGTHTNQGTLVILLEIREAATEIVQASARVTMFVQSEPS